MTAALMFIHTVAAVLLIVVILMQSGRGGGLTEGFAPAESLFGAKTNQFMVRATTIVAVVFLVTCLSLAYLNSRQTASLIPETSEEDVMPAETGAAEAEKQAAEGTAQAPTVTLPAEIAPEQTAAEAQAPVDSGQVADAPQPAETTGN